MIRRWLTWLSRRKEELPLTSVDRLEAHERPMGKFLQMTEGRRFEPLRSLEEARQHTDAFVILQGDWGGQIYVVAPVADVLCSEPRLRRLLLDLDKSQWSCNDGEGAELFFERLTAPAGVAGGMGGGMAAGSVWVHRALEESGWGDTVRHVLGGQTAQS
jgi:hypothetical protein